MVGRNPDQFACATDVASLRMCSRKEIFAKIQLDIIDSFQGHFLFSECQLMCFHTFVLKLHGKGEMKFCIFRLEVNIRALRVL